MKIFDMKDYIPTPEEMQNRELAYNLADDTLSLKTDSGLVQRILSFVGIRNDISNIVTSGSNANGHWVKFSDGTLIMVTSLKSVTPTNPWATSAADFPVPCINTDYLAQCIIEWQDDPMYLQKNHKLGSPTSTISHVEGTIQSPLAKLNNKPIYYRYLIVGRWK